MQSGQHQAGKMKLVRSLTNLWNPGYLWRSAQEGIKLLSTTCRPIPRPRMNHTNDLKDWIGCLGSNRGLQASGTFVADPASILGVESD